MKKNITRLDNKFNQCKMENRAALNCFTVAGDPNYHDSLKILITLAKSGADIIELGMPFSDPSAEGLIIQLAHQRALTSKQTLNKTLNLVHEFRKINQDIPIILMGYYNPIYKMGCINFLNKANTVGVDGLIIVDLPPEADNELCLPAIKNNINFIRLVTPTTNKYRLPKVLQNTNGFLYYISINGITGAVIPNISLLKEAYKKIKIATTLPIIIGFGIKNSIQAGNIAKFADGVVIGSILIDTIFSTIINNCITIETLKQLEQLIKPIKTAIIKSR